MEKFELKAELRDVKSTQPDKLRKLGLLPAVLYGRNISSLALTVKTGEFEKILKKAGESTVVNLHTGDGLVHPVLIHDIQSHFLTSVPQHVDFYEVSMTEKLKAKVVLEYSGESKAVKELGGVLVKVLNEIEVQCLPQDLPHSVLVDIGALNAFEDSIHVSDLKVSDKVQVITPANETIAKVQPPRDVEAELAVPVEEKVEEVIAASTEAKPAGEAEQNAEGPKAEAKEDTKAKKE